MCAAGGRALGSLIAKHKKTHGLLYTTFTKLYESTVVPVVDYGSEIWGAKSYPKCDNVQKRAIRSFLGAGKFSPLPTLQGDMGWAPPYIPHRVSMIRLWVHLRAMPTSRLTRRICDWDMCQGCSGVKSWSKEVVDILEQCNLQLYLDTPEVSHDILQESLISSNSREWRCIVESMPKLRSYKLLQETPTVAGYVKLYMTTSNRSTLAWFRNGTFPLLVETGRYVGIPPHQRLCNACGLGCVEDELHYLLDCPSAILALQNVQGTLECYSKLKDKHG